MRGKSERWKGRACKTTISLSLSLSSSHSWWSTDRSSSFSLCLLVSSLISAPFSCLVSLTVLHSFFFPFPSKNHSQHLISLLLCDSFFFPPSSFLPLRFSCYSFFSSFPFPALSSLQRRKQRRKAEKKEKGERKHTKRKKLQERKERQKEQRRRISGEGEEWSGRAFLHPLNQRISIDFFPKKLGDAFYPKVLPNFSESMYKNYIIKNAYYFRINKNNTLIIKKTICLWAW